MLPELQDAVVAVFCLRREGREHDIYSIVQARRDQATMATAVTESDIKEPEAEEMPKAPRSKKTEKTEHTAKMIEVSPTLAQAFQTLRDASPVGETIDTMNPSMKAIRALETAGALRH